MKVVVDFHQEVMKVEEVVVVTVAEEEVVMLQEATMTLVIKEGPQEDLTVGLQLRDQEWMMAIVAQGMAVAMIVATLEIVMVEDTAMVLIAINQEVSTIEVQYSLTSNILGT